LSGYLYSVSLKPDNAPVRLDLTGGWLFCVQVQRVRPAVQGNPAMAENL
jgi:hypothetical protein